MGWDELKRIIIPEYDSKNLKSNQRFTTLDKIDLFIKKRYKRCLAGINILFSIPKENMKKEYGAYKGSVLNDAENSVFNEIYRQLEKR